MYRLWMGSLAWLRYLSHTQVIEGSNLSPSIDQSREKKIRKKRREDHDSIGEPANKDRSGNVGINIEHILKERVLFTFYIYLLTYLLNASKQNRLEKVSIMRISV